MTQEPDHVEETGLARVDAAHRSSSLAPREHHASSVASPFGDEPRGKARRAGRLAMFVALPMAALAAVYFTTRGSTRAAATAGHDHAAMMSSGDSSAPVALSSEQSQRIGVTYAAVETAGLGKEIRTVGQVTFNERRVQEIAPKIEGWVERLYVNFTGQAVGAGDPLLTIYSPMLVTAQEELLLAKKLASSVAGGTADAAGGATDLVRSARRRLAAWDISAAEIERIERGDGVQRTITLHSPASGIIVEKSVVAGQRIMAGQSLYRVADLGTIWVEGEVFEQDLRSVRLGQTVAATFDAFPGETWDGRITYIYPTLDPVTRTARVRVELPNPKLRLKPGMYATLRFSGASSAGAVLALSVPRSAVLSTGERSLVFVKRADGQLAPREIKVGVATDDRIEVLSGLALGDTVVASATFLIDAESNLGRALGGMANMPGMNAPPSSKGLRDTGQARTPPPKAQPH